MSHYVPGALGSKWGNPFIANIYGLDRCLEMYEDHVRRDPELFNAVMELEGKEIGCWCKPGPCHGDILIKIFNERETLNNDSHSDNMEQSTLELCGENLTIESSKISCATLGDTETTPDNLLDEYENFEQRKSFYSSPVVSVEPIGCMVLNLHMN